MLWDHTAELHRQKVYEMITSKIHFWSVKWLVHSYLDFSGKVDWHQFSKNENDEGYFCEPQSSQDIQGGSCSFLETGIAQFFQNTSEILKYNLDTAPASWGRGKGDNCPTKGFKEGKEKIQDIVMQQSYQN